MDKIYFRRPAELDLLMPILPIDSGRYGSKEMRKIFDDAQRLQYQLDFEAAVAGAQARIGMIPSGAAAEIARAARSGRITLARVAELESASEHDTAAMVEALGRFAGAVRGLNGLWSEPRRPRYPFALNVSAGSNGQFPAIVAM